MSVHAVGVLLLLACSAAAQAPSPATRIALVVDTSDSMTSHMPFRRGDRTLLTDAAVALAAALRPDEAVSVDSFGPGLRIRAAALRREEFTAAADALNDQTGGASPLWDALDATVRSLDGTPFDQARGRPGRRAIVVVTDGRTTGNRLSFAEVLERLRLARVPVFFLCADRPKQAHIADPSVRLRQIAAATGGEYYAIGNHSGFAKPKPEVMRRAMSRVLERVRKGADGMTDRRPD